MQCNVLPYLIAFSISSNLTTISNKYFSHFLSSMLFHKVTCMPSTHSNYHSSSCTISNKLVSSKYHVMLPTLGLQDLIIPTIHGTYQFPISSIIHAHALYSKFINNSSLFIHQEGLLFNKTYDKSTLPQSLNTRKRENPWALPICPKIPKFLGFLIKPNTFSFSLMEPLSNHFSYV